MILYESTKLKEEAFFQLFNFIHFITTLQFVLNKAYFFNLVFISCTLFLHIRIFLAVFLKMLFQKFPVKNLLKTSYLTSLLQKIVPFAIPIFSKNFFMWLLFLTNLIFGYEARKFNLVIFFDEKHQGKKSFF